ncbi:MAG TPA: hypothetical protein PLK28_18885 [Candidatus Rifleibacterium sp.]|nr:hypothetical protein [Candidatus Rifleibacterium sp.]
MNKIVDNEIQQLITQGECKRAIEAAKKAFKRNPGPESRADLISAYLARIDELEKRGDTASAIATRAMLDERFPGSAEEIHQLFLTQKNTGGSKVERALIALIEASDPATCRACEEELARTVVDPQQIALSKILDDSHPLKRQALSVSRAFNEVTTNGSMADQTILSQMKGAVDRNSPLSSWRRAIMAIHAFYSGAYDSMRVHLSGISTDYPVYTVCLALRALAGQSAFEAHHPAAAIFTHLKNEATVELTTEQLRDLDDIFLCAAAKKMPKMNFRTAELFKAVKKRSNALFMRLARLWLHTLAPWENECDLDNPLQFLAALGVPYKKSIIWLAYGHAESDQLIGAQVLASSAILPDVSSFFNGRELGWMMYKAAFIALHEDQTGISYGPKKQMSCEKLLALAKGLWPGAPIHSLRLMSMRLGDEQPAKIEEELNKWHNDEPDNIQPVLELLESACFNKTFRKALNYLTAAEKIDPLHPFVKNARLQIMLANLLDRFATGRGSTLIPGEIRAFARLIAPGDHRRFVVWTLAEACRLGSGGEKAGLCPEYRPAHPAVEQILAWGAGLWLKASKPLILPDPKSCSDAGIFLKEFGRACAGFLAFGKAIPVDKRLVAYMQALMQGLLPWADLEDDLLLAICDTLAKSSRLELLFHASGAGLRRNSLAAYKYLFFRHLSLKPVNARRAREVLQAAEFYAESANDGAYIKKRILDDAVKNSLMAGRNRLLELITGSPLIDNAPPSKDACVRILEAEKASHDWKKTRKKRAEIQQPDLLF